MTTPISARTNADSPGTTRPKAAGPTRNPPSELTDDRWLTQPPGYLLAELGPHEQEEKSQHDVERRPGGGRRVISGNLGKNEGKRRRETHQAR